MLPLVNFKFLVCFLAGTALYGAEPRVLTVPASAVDGARPHEAYSSRRITLKGTSSLQGQDIRATWDFGDGTQPSTFAVESGYDVSAAHTYFGAPGTLYEAKLTVENRATGESSSAKYRVLLREKSLEAELTVAVDEALWYLHKTLRADASQRTSWNLLALESQGFLASGDASNPYTETVALALEELLRLPEGSRDDAFYEALAISGSPAAGAVLAKSGRVATAARRRLGTSGKQDTASRLRSLSASGVGRPNEQWIRLEAQLRDQNNFDLPIPTIYELTQALRTHNESGEDRPLRTIQSETLGELDWFSAQLAAGDTTDGVARVLVGRQAANGSFPETGDATAKAILAVRAAGSNAVTNVTAQFTATNTAWAFNRATQRYTSNLTITNTGGQTLTGPFNIGVLALPATASLVNATGTFNGAPYIVVPGVPSLGPGQTATVQLQVVITPASVITFTPMIYTGTFPPSALMVACPASVATLNVLYTSALMGSGGSLAYSYSIGPGTLPGTLTFNPTTGEISGTPTSTGVINFTANVTDSAGPVAQTASMPCTITVSSAVQPDLTISKAHTGNFTQGSSGNTYTVVVTNTGTGDKTAGQLVTVTDVAPSGLTVTAMSGTGWTCTTLPACTRTDVLLASAAYPAITVTVGVVSNATSPQVNSVNVTTAQTESNTGNNTATDSTVIVQPDLTITKTHTGDFAQGSTANNYTVTVSNSGAGDKLVGQSVSVTDTAPADLTVTAMSGSGWTCTTLPTCTRTDALTAGSAYPPITVTVSVDAAATSPKVNSVAVTTTQNESNGTNNVATDSTVITVGSQPDLTIAKTHTGSFTQGSTGNTYTVTVTNSGSADKTAGQSVSVTDSAPSGLTVTAMSGAGWTCTTLPTCTRTDVLAAAASYPAITVTVSVTSGASSPQVNSVSVTTAQTESNSVNNTATDSTVIVQPDLTITKTHTGSFTQGSTADTYTVTVTNSGAGDKLAGQSVSVTDNPPAGLTVTAMSGTGWTCTTLPTCTRTDALAPTAAYPAITVTVSVASNAASPLFNAITVTTAQNESNATNNTATDSTVIVQPDLTISKTHTGDFAQGSTGNNYTVTVTNSGTGTKLAGQSVSVTDAAPSGLTVTAMSGAGWTCTTLPTCTRNDILAAAASYPAITVTVSVDAGATSPKVNSVTVTTAQNESNSGNNTATDTTVISVTAQPDLTITKTHSGNFTQGSTGNDYTVIVTNSGSGSKTAGQSVSVTDAPPSGLTVAAMSGPGWTCTTLPTCTRNDVLAAGGSYPAITVTVSVTAGATSPQVNSITVTTAQTESNSANNTATDLTIIVQPDLTITKTHSGNFSLGSTGNTYTVTVTNSGLGTKLAGQSVSVTDAPPTGLSVTAMSGTGWTCTTLPTCTRNDVLAPAASYPALTVTVSVTTNATSPRVNSITVTTAQAESNTGNNTATDSTVIVGPDLTITKSHTGNFSQGSTGNTYTVTVTNSGTGDKLAGQSVSVTDAAPGGLTVTAMSGSGWTCTTLPTCTRTDLLATSSSYPAITVTVSVSGSAASNLVNSVTVTTAQSETNAANNTATDSTIIVQPDLTITKSHAGNFLQGSTGNTYTVTVTNSGQGDKNAGQSVSVTDAPPPGLTVTAMSGTGWTCTTLPTCTRTDVLTASSSYPALTVTVTVAANATTPQVNSITVTTAQLESNAGNNTATDSTDIEAPPTITSGNAVTFNPGKTGQSFTVTTTGLPSGASMVITQTGALPSGVNFTNNNNGTATINGTPAAGTQGVTGTPRSQGYPLTINANNGINPPASQPFTLTIACPTITVSGSATISGVHNAAITPTTYTQLGGSGTIAWSATGLPTNLTIGGGTGTVSGTPNVTGTFSVVVTATDAGGCTGTRAVTVSVGPNLSPLGFTGVGNTQLFITGVSGAPSTPAVSAAIGVLAGATPIGQINITNVSCTSGGAINTFDAAGRFVFTPNVSATSATCSYSGTSNTGAGSTGAASTTANLTFTLNNKVWYVTHGAAGGDGRSNTPFGDFGAGANQLNCTSTTANGDFIYVAQGSGNTTGSCTLKTNQSLIGAGATLNVPAVSPILTVTGNSANTPTLTSTLSVSSVNGLTVNGISLSTGSSAAASLSGTNGKFTFRSINTSGAGTPITLSGTTSGFTFTVNGDGTGRANGSGGSLTNSTVAALTATTSTGTVDLKSMNVSITINASYGILFDNNSGGTLTGNITGCTFTGVGGAANIAQQKALLQYEGGGAANVTANVQNSFFFNNRTYGLFAAAAGTSTMNVTLNQSGFGTDVNTGNPVNTPGTTITNAPPFSVGVTNASGANVHYNITNNTFWGARSADGALYAVTISGATATGTLNGFFTNNKIGKTGTVGSGCLGNCAGLGLLPGNGGTFNATVSNNDIRQVGAFGINFFNSVSGSTVNMIGHFTNNTLAENDNTSGAPAVAQRAIVVSPGNSGGAAVNSCAEITGNNISGNWQAGFFIRITTNNTTGTLVIPGLTPATGAVASQVNTYVQSLNTLPASSVGTTVGSGPINGGAACTATP